MSESFYLRAVEGRLARDPKTQVPLSEKGERKPKTSYWIRRLRSGDVVEVGDHGARPAAGSQGVKNDG